MHTRSRPKKTAISLLSRFNIGVARYSELKRLRDVDRDHQFVMALDPEVRGECLNLLSSSPAQLRQDLFALASLGFKREGYFVEFGATDGVTISNTHLLEKRFAWKGILAEPARCWHNALMRNRSAHVDTSCVWSESGAELTFEEVEGGELSRLKGSGLPDPLNDPVRAQMQTSQYEVTTISLMDLLSKHRAPPIIDYLSLDTEGSEYDILASFDFSAYAINVITVEHAYTEIREKLYKLLSQHGFVRKLEHISQWDDWYVRRELA